MAASEKMNTFYAKPGPAHNRARLTFEPLNTENLKIQMNLEDEGTSRGRKNLPPSSAKYFDDIGLKIVSAINAHVKTATENYYDDIRSFEDRMNRLNAASTSGKIETISISAEADFQSHVYKLKHELYTARTVAAGCEAELDSFKREHGLQRPAMYPKSRVWPLVIAALLIGAETGANGVFSAQDRDIGLLGGIFTAFAPSFLNGLAGLYLGNVAARLMIHRRRSRKIFGCLFGVAIFSLAVIMNLAFARYRSAGIPALPEDTASWRLFGLSIGFFLCAACNFWKMDDPYWRYGEMERQYKAKLASYARKKASILDELEHLRDDRLNELDEALGIVNAKYNEATAIYASKRRWADLYSDHMKHLESAGRELLAYYHTVNMGERASSPPEYFLQEWSLDYPGVPSPATDFMQILGGLQSEAAGVQPLHAECAGRIGKLYLKALKEFDIIDQPHPQDLNRGFTGNGDGGAGETLATAA